MFPHNACMDNKERGYFCQIQSFLMYNEATKSEAAYENREMQNWNCNIEPI